MVVIIADIFLQIDKLHIFFSHSNIFFSKELILLRNLKIPSSCFGNAIFNSFFSEKISDRYASLAIHS